MDINELIGKSIKEIRYMTDREMESVGWDDCRQGTSIVLDDGTVLFANQDDEGNGPGTIFGSKDDVDFHVFPPEEK